MSCSMACSAADRVAKPMLNVTLPDDSLRVTMYVVLMCSLPFVVGGQKPLLLSRQLPAFQLVHVQRQRLAPLAGKVELLLRVAGEVVLVRVTRLERQEGEQAGHGVVTVDGVQGRAAEVVAVEHELVEQVQLVGQD